MSINGLAGTSQLTTDTLCAERDCSTSDPQAAIVLWSCPQSVLGADAKHAWHFCTGAALQARLSVRWGTVRRRGCHFWRCDRGRHAQHPGMVSDGGGGGGAV